MSVQETVFNFKFFKLFIYSIKKCSKWLPVLATLIAALGFTSCQKEETVEPIKPAIDKSARLEASSILVPKKYFLTKLGAHTLEYDAAQQLKKVNYTPNLYATHESGWDDEYKYIWMYTKLYIDGKKFQYTNYKLDGDRAIRSTTTHLDSQTGTYLSHQIHHYVYNAQGQLEKRLRTHNNQYVRDLQFHYNHEGNLAKVEEFTLSGALSKTTEFTYSSISAPVNKYGFNPEIPQLDNYLRIFGVFFKKMPTFRKVDNTDGNHADSRVNIEYTLDSYGYPVKRHELNLNTGQGGYIEYEYLKINMGLQ